jgi:3-oxoacyl-(acyl-carrier-protein) synthase
MVKNSRQGQLSVRNYLALEMLILVHVGKYVCSLQDIAHCIAGPSCIMDAACSSSSYAFEQAYRSILDGCCDPAIVGGAQLCLHPYKSLQFSQLSVLSPEGCCKVFDNSGKHSSAVRFCVLLWPNNKPFA